VRWLAALLLVLSLPAWGQGPPIQPLPVVGTSGGTAYTGPGDVYTTGIQTWGGLRAYSKATAGTKAIQVTRLSDSTTHDVNSLANGQLDIASANSFAGTDATCTGTISGTTMSISSCSAGTLHVTDTLTGAGINQPAYITAIGTCAAPPGTCTLNKSQTVAVGETITAQVSLVVSKLYDKTGALFCGGAVCDLNTPLAPSTTDGPFLIPTCINSLPCMRNPSGQTRSLESSAAASWGTSGNSPFSFSTIAIRLTNTTSYGFLLGNNNNSNGAGFSNAANTAVIFDGSNHTATMSDNAWHAIQVIFNSASSNFNIDGTNTAVSTSAVNFGSSSIFIGQNFGGNHLGEGYFTEAGVWSGATSSGNQTALCRNEQAFYGSGNFGAAC
jgi:hypothetical protein